MSVEIDEIRAFVLEASRKLLDTDITELAVDEKSGAFNFATEMDKAMQRLLIGGLHELLPSAYFLAEEADPENLTESVPQSSLDRMMDQGSVKKMDPDWLFVIDPIDGTSNFMLDLKHSCVSVALFHQGQAFYSIVVQPWTHDVYEFREGLAYYNDKVLDRSAAEGLAGGLIGFGTSPYRSELDNVFIKKVIEVFQRCIDIRRSGSAALDICYVAAGKYQLFCEASLEAWDYAAARMIAEAAHCVVRTLKNEPIDTLEQSSFVVGTAAAIEEFFDPKLVEVRRK